MFKRYWADLAFECNLWGAYCSKVSPNVNVLGLLQVRGAACMPPREVAQPVQHACRAIRLRNLCSMHAAP